MPQPSTSNTPPPAPASTTVASPGRPSSYNQTSVELICAFIRQFGLSDSAAAERAGVSTSTLSRWKRDYPDLKLAFLQARVQCRAMHQQIILSHAREEGGRGWRASAWILEHTFPGDYCMRASEREKFQQPERRNRELEAAEDARLAEETPLTSSVTDSHNSRNSVSAPTPPAAPTPATAAPTDARQAQTRPSATPTPAPTETHATTTPTPATVPAPQSSSSGKTPRIYSERDSHNCRNSPTPAPEPAPPTPPPLSVKRTKPGGPSNPPLETRLYRPLKAAA